VCDSTDLCNCDRFDPMWELNLTNWPCLCNARPCAITRRVLPIRVGVGLFVSSFVVCVGVVGQGIHGTKAAACRLKNETFKTYPVFVCALLYRPTRISHAPTTNRATNKHIAAAWGTQPMTRDPTHSSRYGSVLLHRGAIAPTPVRKPYF